MIEQISVFVENKFGRLAAITNVLRDNDIDISALSLADTSEFGILRLIVDKPAEAVTALKAAGIMVKSTGVVAAAMDDKPGGLALLLNILTDENVSIEYMYAFLGQSGGSAWTVLQTEDNEKAESLFAKAGIKTLQKMEK